MNNIKTQSAKTWLILVIGLLAWSSAFVFIRIGLSGYSPGPLALFRYLISSVVMFLFYARLKVWHLPTHKEAFQLFLIGFFGIAVYMVALNYGEQTVSASIASFLIGLNPIVSLVWVRTVLKESISFKRWLGITVSAIGVGVIAFSKYQDDTLDWHVVFILIATVCGGIYNVAQKPFLTKFHPIETAAITAWFATLSLLLYFPQLIHEIPKAPLHATHATIYLAVVSSAIGFICWTYALSSKIPASKLVPVLYTLPIFSTLLGWIMLHEIPGTLALIGGCISLFGALIATT